MGKFKTTKKAMKNSYHQIIKIGYCDAEFLLYYKSPIAYSTRSEGWACDYYDIDGVLISTGYAPLDDKNTRHNYELTREYDQKAREIVYSPGVYEENREKVTELLHQFIKEVTKNQN